jgi:hypothetical protein
MNRSGERAIAPKPEGSNWGWRHWLANTTFTFGINNVFNTSPPLSANWFQGTEQPRDHRGTNFPFPAVATPAEKFKFLNSASSVIFW